MVIFGKVCGSRQCCFLSSEVAVNGETAKSLYEMQKLCQSNTQIVNSSALEVQRQMVSLIDKESY